MNYKYKIFVIFHDNLNLSYYDSSLIKNFIFVNVRPNNTNAFPKEYNVINLHEFENFIPLGKWYTESEVIYNVYKNKYLYENIDFIGFIQYDIDSSPLTEAIIQQAISENLLVSFEPHLFKDDYNRNFLMDEKKPNTLCGKGVNCYDVMFNDFNQFYQSNNHPTLYFDKTITLCSSFIVKVNLFSEMMDFISLIIESGKLNKFDIKHAYRIQGGFLERYYGVWFLLKNIPFIEKKLIHLYEETHNQMTLFEKIKRKVKKVLSYGSN